MHRYPQLDTLRAFAVAGVLLSHFSPTLGALPIELGAMGVRLFFVLSGFLITGILLRGRAAWAGGGTIRRTEVARFYARRALRILPVFYALLVLSFAFDIAPYRQTFWWHAGYLSNFLIAREGHWIGTASHLWSLCVEEQFYLVWPWLVWGLPSAWLPAFFTGVCLIGPVSRGAILAASGDVLATHVLMPCCLDSLGAGALLAWFWQQPGVAASALRRGQHFALALLPLTVVWASVSHNGWGKTVAIPSLQAVGFAGLIGVCACGVSGGLGRALMWSPLLWLGQISYGVYLLHNHANWLGPRLLRSVLPGGRSYFTVEAWQTFYLILLTLLAATVSWYFLERPINRRKDQAFST